MSEWRKKTQDTHGHVDPLTIEKDQRTFTEAFKNLAKYTSKNNFVELSK